MLGAAAHTRADARLPREFSALSPDLVDATRRAADRWSRREPEWAGRFVSWAGGQFSPAVPDVRDLMATRTVQCYGRAYPLQGEGAWRREPSGERVWKVAPHAWIRLDDPRRPGDVRMQWEPARMAHEVRLAQAARAARAARAGDSQAMAVWMEVARSFDAENPIGLGIHWSVGMEISIRASARISALEMARGGGAPLEFVRERLENLALTASYLAAHIERHPSGQTTNHTLAVTAGLALVAELFRGSAQAEQWRVRARGALDECLAQQVLIGGAHAEASLAYARFAAEAAFVGAAALELPVESESAQRLLRLIEFLERTALPSGLPHLGDCDESFFPPFGLEPWESRDPFDARPVATAVRRWWNQPASERLRAPILQRPPGSGLVRFADARFDGILVTRGRGDGWMPTHGHNDLLSVALDLDGAPLLIDPGTGGYAWDRGLRHELRSVGAHSTLQVGDEEPWPLRPRVLFEGPGEVDGGCEVSDANTLRVTAWQDGFDGVRVTRRLRLRGGVLWIADAVTLRAGGTRAADMQTSTLRFVLATGLSVTLAPDGCAQIARADDTHAPHAEFLLLHPEESGWQIRRAARSRRYAQVEEGIVLEAKMRGRLPHRWLVAIRPLDPVAK